MRGPIVDLIRAPSLSISGPVESTVPRTKLLAAVRLTSWRDTGSGFLLFLTMMPISDVSTYVTAAGPFSTSTESMLARSL